MTSATASPPGPVPTWTTVRNAAGLAFEINRNGSVRRMRADDVVLTLFVGNEVEGGPTGLWLRRHGGAGVDSLALLGPRSPATPHVDAQGVHASVAWRGLEATLQLVLHPQEPAWFWHVQVRNVSDEAQTVDLVHAQDVGLASYDALRVNEHYVSQYIDIQPLRHARAGHVLAARQNQPVAGRHPWLLLGSLRRAASFATDALQFHGLAARDGAAPPGLAGGLPETRLQHEHAMLALQDEAVTLAPGASVGLGFFGRFQAHHPEATGTGDLREVDATLALPIAAAPPARSRVAAQAPAAHATATHATATQATATQAMATQTTATQASAAQAMATQTTATQASAAQAPATHASATQALAAHAPVPSLFVEAPLLDVRDLAEHEIEALFGSERRHEEREAGALHSFFVGADGHVALRAKERAVLRPHGHILRTGSALAPDEAALTSTVWMAGVFHSMVTQGHVSVNRFLSTTHGYLGLFRSHGQRVFVRGGDRCWRLLGVPSAFEMRPARCRWLYAHADGLLEVCSAARDDAHVLELHVRVLAGPPLDVRVTHHVALGGDDGSAPGSAAWTAADGAVSVATIPGTALGDRFPQGRFAIEPLPGTAFSNAGGDELLFPDGRSRGQPFVCVGGAAAPAFGLRLVGRLVTAPATTGAAALALPSLLAPPASPLAREVQQLADIMPWFAHDALVHYLAPRGLEQYTGGGWGTRDVCQGPLEMLLALGRHDAVRDLLLRVFSAQNADGDWPQWFMFFERDRDVRAPDSHGDIVLWPLLGLARYLEASGDWGMLGADVPWHGEATATPLLEHVQRALALVDARRIPGTELVAYGHGDWNDALQPADPALRERLCSAWTVTLHFQTLRALAGVLGEAGRAQLAQRLRAQAERVRADFQRLLLVDGVVTGYALWQQPGDPHPSACLLHPSDRLTGVRYSLLPMMHAVLNDLLTPGQARAHVDLISRHLVGPDGARLFDRPLPYHGGLQRLFQRAESAAFFGREIGLMYTHAHLRWAEMLAHVGDARGLLDALGKAHPIAVRERVAAAAPRQANCYFSSSDAAFADRYEAQAHYDRVRDGAVRLDGGWRIYSSGPGIALSVLVRSFLGLRARHDALVVDPVLPAGLDGLRATVELWETPVEVAYDGAGAVVGLALNGRSLPLRRDDGNGHRARAAEVARSDFQAAVRGRDDRLQVVLGPPAPPGVTPAAP